MAHIAKYKAPSVGHMLAHYRRDASSLGRENIDPTRTKGNYTLGLDDRDGKVRAMNGIEPNWATVEGRIEGVNKAAKAAGKRAVRKDAVVMADVVVTLPENVRKGDEFKFFGFTYWFLLQKLGKENMMGGFVHRDEVRNCGPLPKARAEKCADDDKGAQTRFGGLGEGHESRDAGERSAGCCKGI